MKTMEWLRQIGENGDDEAPSMSYSSSLLFFLSTFTNNEKMNEENGKWTDM